MSTVFAWILMRFVFLYWFFTVIVRWCDSHGAAVTALATIALTIITFFYLLETRHQRQLLEIQFVHTNSPDISFHIGGFPIFSQDRQELRVTIGNHGRAVEDVRMLTVLICNSSVDALVNGQDTPKIIRFNSRFTRVGRISSYPIMYKLSAEQSRTVWDAINNASAEVRMYAYVQVTYMIPPLTYNMRSEQKTDQQAFRYHHIHGLVEAEVQEHDLLTKFLSDRGELR